MNAGDVVVANAQRFAHRVIDFDVQVVIFLKKNARYFVVVQESSIIVSGSHSRLRDVKSLD